MATFEVADSIVAKQAAARISAQKQKQQQKANALNNMLSGLRSKNLSISIPTIAVLSVLSHVDKAPSSFDELVLQAQKLTPRQQFCRQYFRSEGCGSKSCQYSHDPEQCLDALGKLNDLSVALKADNNKAGVGKKKEAAEKKEFCNDLLKRGACKLGAKCPRSHDEKAYVMSHNVKKCPVCGECFCHKNSSECSNCYAARRAEAEAQLHPCGNQSKGCANMCIAELCRDCRAAPKFCYAFFDENECTRQDCAFSHDEALYMKVNALKMCPECKTSYCKESSAECRQCRHVKSLHPCATKDCENRCKAEYCQECNAAYRKEQQKKKDKKERKGPLQCVNFPKYCSNKSVLAYRGECEHCKESQSVYVVRG